jgi:RNA polymerase sigma-70 factor (ECF subfamily)
MAGDAGAYRCFLEAATPYLRSLARRQLAKLGSPTLDAEDIVQETLLTIHLKRSSWDDSRPLAPWIATIARNKVIDALRRNGRKVTLSMDDALFELIEAPAPVEETDTGLLEQMLAGLKQRDRDIVRSISIEERGTRETASRLGMSEGALRVALHRALKALAARYRKERN